MDDEQERQHVAFIERAAMQIGSRFSPHREGGLQYKFAACMVVLVQLPKFVSHNCIQLFSKARKRNSKAKAVCPHSSRDRQHPYPCSALCMLLKGALGCSGTRRAISVSLLLMSVYVLDAHRT